MHTAAEPAGPIQPHLDQVDPDPGAGGAGDGAGRGVQTCEPCGPDALSGGEARPGASGLHLDARQSVAVADQDVDLTGSGGEAPREDSQASSGEVAFGDPLADATEPGRVERHPPQREAGGEERQERAG